MSRGVLTLATGAKRYIDQAVNLARSVRYHSPDLPIAIVTDSDDSVLETCFNEIIQVNARLGPPLRQKLYLEQYTPFTETLFIDADCLAFRNLSLLFSRYNQSYFNMDVVWEHTGVWHGANIGQWAHMLKVEKIPRGNAGVFYFRSEPETERFFADARNEQEMIGTYGVVSNRSEAMMEPPIAVTIIKHNIRCPEFDNTVQITALDGWFNENYSVARSNLIGRRLSDGVVVRPYLLHCLAGEYNTERYRREVIKLKLYYQYKCPMMLAEFFVNTTYFLKRGWKERIRAYVLGRPFAKRGADVRLNRQAITNGPGHRCVETGGGTS